jgi:hypothetical protein
LTQVLCVMQIANSKKEILCAISHRSKQRQKRIYPIER